MLLNSCIRQPHHNHIFRYVIHTNFKRFCHSKSVNDKIIDYLSCFQNKYLPKNCEKFWSSVWEETELFVSKKPDSETTFRLLLPPPNITGSLHLGHSLTVAIQDTLCRYYRMNGENVKWYGGTDHAGIATQIIIEKILWNKYKKTRQDVSRKEFEDIFQKWKCERIDEIHSQLKSMGVSIDFKSNYFTLSPEMSNIVNEAFIELFNRGMIYRASYMVNWSYYLQSTMSDIEIDHIFISHPTEYKVPGCDDSFQLGVIYYFKYPLENPDSNEFITIATTRIESLMGDTALCVHPNDSRYSHLIGKFAYNPFTNEKMPIIVDEAVKPDFGTGVLKLTPAHSSIDYEIATRHKLPIKTIFDEQGLIDCKYEPLNKVHRYAAKKLVQEELAKRGLYCGLKDHAHWLPVCSRSGDIIESRIVPQWFLQAGDSRYIAEFVVNRDNLSESSKEIWSRLKTDLDEDNQNISIIPSSYRNTWKDWFSRYKDWCISRQIYWGHQIPAYEIIHFSKPTNIWIASRSKEEALDVACTKHGFNKEEIDLRQDPDVLDTWFSSALLPLSVTGWHPGKTVKDFPLSIMETGYDIIFFWVARMTLLSLILTNKLPFNRILLHGMICDENGKKMSKSKGNNIDPLYFINGSSYNEMLQLHKDDFNSQVITEEQFIEILKNLTKQFPNGIPNCGADILRLSLLQSRFKEQKVKFQFKKTILKSVFSNKMHHTVRFILLKLKEANFKEVPLNIDEMSKVDKWILSKLAQLITLCRFTFNSYDFYYSTKEIENFWIRDLCGVYLESIKISFNKKIDSFELSMNILLFILRTTLKLMHPFMPFVTENLYQYLEFNLAQILNNDYLYKSILESPYPNVHTDPILKYFDNSYVEEMKCVMAITKKIRWFIQSFFIPKHLIEKIIICSLQENLPKETIESLIYYDGYNLEFANLYDLYKYDEGFCLKVNEHINDTTSDDDDSESGKSYESNSLECPEIYIIFFINKENFRINLEERFKGKLDKCQHLMNEFELFHLKNFTKNYKKLTKIIS